jgi:large subunit ribosomal protein L15
MRTTAVIVTVLSFAAQPLAFTTSTNRLATKTRSKAASPATTMKLFDWKRREANEDYSADAGVFTLDNLSPAPGSHKKKTRKGRGISAGQGATCGFGMRGQRARAGHSVRPGFEGGQTPLYRRLPKKVGKPMGPGYTKTIYNPVKVDALNGAAEGATVNFDSLLESKAVTKSKYKLTKIVGGGELTTKGLTVQAHAFTGSAREAIEGAGGSCVVLSPTTGAVVAAEE